jgi:sec-independent protein translocase protein TatC
MSEDSDPLPEGTLISHLLELRSRLLKAFIAVIIAFCPAWYYCNQIFDFISQPLVAKLPPGQKLIATTVTATFTAPLKLAFVAGLLAAMPYVLYQIWAFVAPAKSVSRYRCWCRPLCCSTLASRFPTSSSFRWPSSSSSRRRRRTWC